MPYFRIETTKEPDILVIREFPKKASEFAAKLLDDFDKLRRAHDVWRGCGGCCPY